MTFHRKVFKNGLRLITVPMKENPTVSVFVLVATGSKYETKKKNGLSHFLEHMVFKGTVKRPTAADISREFDNLGAESNAFTGHEYTGYYAKADAKHFKNIFDVLSDIYLNSTFPEKEIEKEKGVIIEEINMYEDRPDQKVQNIFMKLLYGDTPAGWDIIGTKENIRKMERSDFLTYRKAHYVPKATVVIVAGQISESQVFKEVNKVFGQLKKAPKVGRLKIKEKQKNPALKIEYKKTDQAHLVLGFRAFSLFDKRKPALSVLSALLAGGMSTRLFLRLREEMGVCYYVRGGSDLFTDHGFFSISVGANKDRVEEVIQVVLEECDRLKNDLAPEAELAKAKEYLIGNSKLNLESSDSLAGFYGHQEILNLKVGAPEEKWQKIRLVQAHEIRVLAGEIFKNSRLNLALLGPFKDVKPFRKILKL